MNPLQTFTAQLSRASPDARPIQFASAPGIPRWNEVSPASRLLAEATQCSPASKILVLGTGHGALAAFLARSAPLGEVIACDTSALALAMTGETARLNGITHLSTCSGLSLPPEAEGRFDLAAMELPKGRKLARRWLLESFRLLKPGAPLFLAGANDEGIRSSIADAAELFGEAVTLDLRQRNRVARACRPRNLSGSPPALPDWASLPGIAPGSWYPLELEWEQRRYVLRSLPGIFSFDRLDDGTALLLRQVPDPRGLRVLDFGCGYGFIGLWAALRGAAAVDLVDVSLWAVEAARANLALHGVSAAEALAGDGLEPVAGRRYDLVVSNLPFHVGKEVNTGAADRFLEGVPATLAPNGTVLLVTNGFIRHDAPLRRRFGTVRELAHDGRFRVLLAR